MPSICDVFASSSVPFDVHWPPIPPFLLVFSAYVTGFSVPLQGFESPTGCHLLFLTCVTPIHRRLFIPLVPNFTFGSPLSLKIPFLSSLFPCSCNVVCFAHKQGKNNNRIRIILLHLQSANYKWLLRKESGGTFRRNRHVNLSCMR